MKKLFLLLSLFTIFSNAQVTSPTRNAGGFGAGFTSNDMEASAILEARSTSKGVLFPRMTTTQRNAISSPATSLIIFNTTTGKYNYYTGSAWAELGASGTANPTFDDVLSYGNIATDRIVKLRNSSDSNIRADLESYQARYYDTTSTTETLITPDGIHGYTFYSKNTSIGTDRLICDELGGILTYGSLNIRNEDFETTALGGTLHSNVSAARHWYMPDHDGTVLTNTDVTLELAVANGNTTGNPMIVGTDFNNGLYLHPNVANVQETTSLFVKQTGFSSENFYTQYTDIATGLGYQAYLSPTEGLALSTSGTSSGGAKLKSDLVDHNVTIQLPNEDCTLLSPTDIVGKANLSGADFTGDVTGNAIPAGDTSFITKNYLDNQISGITWKQAVKCATTANVSLSGTSNIDGVTIPAGTRILVKNQTTTTDNGIYVSAAGAWSRATDADTGIELETSTVAVTAGTVNKNTQWTCTSSSITVGTTPIAYGQISGAGTYTNGTGIDLTANVFSINSSVTTNSGTQTLTNKSISGSTNTLTNIAQSSVTNLTTDLASKLNSTTAVSTYATIASPTFTGTVSGVTKSMVGLGSVDNTADTDKPISTATQTALDTKAIKSEFMILSSPNALSNSTGLQKMFNVGSSGNGAFNTGSNKTYKFRIEFDMSGLSGSSSSIGFGFLGTANISTISYKANAAKNTLITINQANIQSVQTSAQTTISSATTNTTAKGIITGIIRITTSGTLIPAISTSVGNTTSQVDPNSYFEIIEIGSNTLTATSNIN